jgi:hypothetical protein
MTQLQNDLMTKKSFELQNGSSGINSAIGTDIRDAGKTNYPLSGR